jgi:hypothetical protein
MTMVKARERRRARRATRSGMALVMVTVTIVAAGSTGSAAVPRRSPSGAVSEGAPSQGADVAAGLATSRAPKAPVRICGTKSLDGPAKRPQGAKRVSTNRDLGAMAANSPKGTTFWLEPGVHTLGGGEFDQVIPRDGQTFIGAPGAILDGQQLNRYAFTQPAENVTIEHLTIQNFKGAAQEGVVNHDYGRGWTIKHNTIKNNGGAGVFLGSDTIVAGNCLVRNGQYGFSAYSPDGIRNVVLRRNEIAYNNQDDWEAQWPGCGCTAGGKFWETTGAKVVKNYVHHNIGTGVWVDYNNTGFLIKDNFFRANEGIALFYEVSYNGAIVDNTFVRNGHVEGPELPGFPLPTIYVSESGSDSRVGARFGSTFDITGNRLVDNWAGIIGWENSDRFVGAVEGNDLVTRVNPGVATLANCSDPDTIETAPYFDDCRWKTQNLRVTRNRFVLRPDRVPGCTPEAGCGFTGLVSNYGTWPDWSPYQANIVPDAITFEQNNRWAQNRYVGPWHFMIHQLFNEVSWRTWRSDKYGQDLGSTRTK